MKPSPKRIMSALLCTAMLCASLPLPAYASSQTYMNADEAYKQASAALETAENDVRVKKTAWDAAAAEASRLETAMGQSTSATYRLESFLDEIFISLSKTKSAMKREAETAENKAKSLLTDISYEEGNLENIAPTLKRRENNAAYLKGVYDETLKTGIITQADVDEAKRAADAAKAAADRKAAELADATTDTKQKKNALPDFLSALEREKQAFAPYTAATAAAEAEVQEREAAAAAAKENPSGVPAAEMEAARKKVENAQKTYDEAYAEYADGSFGFFRWLAKQDVSEGTKNDALGAYNNVLLKGNKAQYIKRGDITDPTSLSNMKATFPQMRRVNELRVRDGRRPLYVSSCVMAEQQASIAWAIATDNMGNHPNSTTYNQCAGGGRVNGFFADACYAEKKEYEAYLNSPYYPDVRAYKNYYKEKNPYLYAFNPTIWGHWTMMMSNVYHFIGYGTWQFTDGYKGLQWSEGSRCHYMGFDGRSIDQAQYAGFTTVDEYIQYLDPPTVDEYEALFDTYVESIGYAPAKEALKEAKAELAALTRQDNLVEETAGELEEARRNLTEKKAAEAEARKALDAAQKAYDDAAAAYEAAKAGLAEKQTASDEAANEYNRAKNAYDAKAERLKNGNSGEAEAERIRTQYENALRLYNTTKAEYDAKKKVVDGLQAEYDAADADAKLKRSNYNSLQTLYDLAPTSEEKCTVILTGKLDIPDPRIEEFNGNYPAYIELKTASIEEQARYEIARRAGVRAKEDYDAACALRDELAAAKQEAYDRLNNTPQYYPLEECTAGQMGVWEYTGKTIMPEVYLLYKGVLIDSSSYTLSYKNNVNPGTATITAAGKGQFSGKKTVTFTIRKKNQAPSISVADITLGQAPSPVVKAETAYTVDYSLNGGAWKAKPDAAGTWTARVTAKETSTVSGAVATCTFTVNADSLSGSASDDDEGSEEASGSSLGPGTENAAEKALKAQMAAKLSAEAKDPDGSVFLFGLREKSVGSVSATLAWDTSGEVYIFGGELGKAMTFLTKSSSRTALLEGLVPGTVYQYAAFAVSGGKITSASKKIYVAARGGKYTNTAEVLPNENIRSTLKLARTIGQGYNLIISNVPEEEGKTTVKAAGTRFHTTNAAVATVSSAGRIIGAGEGSCDVYAMAENGRTVKITVTVTKPAEDPDKAVKDAISKRLPSGEGDPVNSGYFFGLSEKSVTSNSITLGWNAVSGATYYVYGSKCGQRPAFLGKTTATTWTHKNLESPMYYHYAVFAVKGGKIEKASKTVHIAVGNAFTNVKTLKLNTGNRTVYIGNGYNLSIMPVMEKEGAMSLLQTGYRFYSTNAAAAAVNASGRITAKAPGKADIYVFAQNGRYVKITVTAAKKPTDPDKAVKDAIAKRLQTGEADAAGSAYFFGLSEKSAGSNSITLGWNAVSGAAYYVYGAKCGQRQAFLGKTTSAAWTHKNLASGTYYHYTVFAVKSGKIEKVSKTVHIATATAFTNAGRLTLNTGNRTIHVGKGYNLKVTPVLERNGGRTLKKAPYRFYSTNAKAAAVNASGRITAKAPGKADIYVFAQNGRYTKITVTVK